MPLFQPGSSSSTRSELAATALFAGKWLLLAGVLGAIVGSACALFLWALEGATKARLAHPILLFALPVIGTLIAAVYAKWGRGAGGNHSESGNNLLMDEIHQEGGGVPRRMAPLILLATVATHIGGGSAGREGTALQMGGALAATLGRLWKLDRNEGRTLLMCGIAAGFGGVFGTPLAGAVFALEVLTLGRIDYGALLPCFIASVAGAAACAAWGMEHTHYAIATHGAISGEAPFDWLLGGKVALAAIVFGGCSVLFGEMTHGVGTLFKTYIKHPLARPFIGGCLVIALTYLLGTRDYLGLGVHSADPHAVTILSCFQAGGANFGSWWWKLLFTAFTLGSGFKGGEVTPLFFIGAALGNSLSEVLWAPVDLFAGLGFIAVFAGATNTPLACTLMGIELFGGHYAVYFMIACFVAYLCSGHRGIYGSQRIATPKFSGADVPDNASLNEVRAARPKWKLPRRTIEKPK